jgi:hypothetical protein
MKMNSALNRPVDDSGKLLGGGDDYTVESSGNQVR